MIDQERFRQIMEIVNRDLDSTTRAIVQELINDGNRLAIIRDAFMTGQDTLAVKMIRDLDPMRSMQILPISSDLRAQHGSSGLTPGMSAIITARPQICPFYPRWLLLARETADVLDIHDIKIGNGASFVAAGDVPGELFAVDMPSATLELIDQASVPTTFGTHDGELDPIYTLRIDQHAVDQLPLPLDFRPVQHGQEITIICGNVSDRPLVRFRGAFIGATGAMT